MDLFQLVEDLAGFEIKMEAGTETAKFVEGTTWIEAELVKRSEDCVGEVAGDGAPRNDARQGRDEVGFAIKRDLAGRDMTATYPAN